MRTIRILAFLGLLTTGAALASTTTIQTLNNTQQLLMQQQLSRSASNQVQPNMMNTKRGNGIPVYDAGAIEVEKAKVKLYEQWKLENKSDIGFKEWQENIEEGKYNEK